MSHSRGESFDKSDRVDDKDSKWNVEVGDTRHSRGGDRAFYTVTDVYFSFYQFFFTDGCLPLILPPFWHRQSALVVKAV